MGLHPNDLGHPEDKKFKKILGEYEKKLLQT